MIFEKEKGVEAVILSASYSGDHLLVERLLREGHSPNTGDVLYFTIHVDVWVCTHFSFLCSELGRMDATDAGRSWSQSAHPACAAGHGR